MAATLLDLPAQQPGSLDTSFDPTGGGTFTGLTLSDTDIRSLAVQPDKKLVIGGAFVGAGGLARAGLARLNADGTVDPGFTPMAWPATSSCTVMQVALQPDGKILALGNDGLRRLGTDGRVDPNFQPQASSTCRLFALRSDGKILIAGGDLDSSYIDRLNSDGTLDSTFTRHVSKLFIQAMALTPDGTIIFSAQNWQTKGVFRLDQNGLADTGFSTSVDYAVHVLAPAADGKIWIGGEFTSVNSHPRPGVARLNANGDLDATWQPALPSAHNHPWVEALLPQSDGSLIISGTRPRIYDWGSTLPGYFLLAKLRPDGTEDPQFTAALGPITNSPYAIVRTLAQTSSGALLAGGASVPGTLVRVAAGGSVDALFKPNVQGAPGFGTAVSVLPDGTALVHGEFTSLAGEPRPGLARVHADGTLDTHFLPGISQGLTVLAYARQTDGKVLVAAGSRFQSEAELRRLHEDGSLDHTFSASVTRTNGLGAITALLVQPDGRIVIAGDFDFVNATPRRTLARLLANGALDPSFDPGTGLSAEYRTPEVNALVFQPDGKILLAGTFEQVGGIARKWLARVHADGSVDAGFHATYFEPQGNELLEPVSLLLQPGGKILAGLRVNVDRGLPIPALVRFMPDGQLDPSFHLGTGVTAGSDIGLINGLALQPDGKILAGGAFDTFHGTATPNLVRLDSDGRLDPTFQVTWHSGTNYISPWEIGDVNALAVAADGRVLLAGRFKSISGQQRWGLARLHADLEHNVHSRVETFGYSLYGITDLPADLTNAIAIRAGSHHSAALRADGSIVGWGMYGQELAGNSNLVEIAAGSTGHALAVRLDGSVIAAGPNNSGECSLPGDLHDPVALAAGYRFGLALRQDGTVAAWGAAESDVPNVPAGVSNVVAISASGEHALALRTDGTVVAWGMNQYGQCNVPPGITNAVAVAAGSMHSLALLADGQLIGWGDNYHGALTIPTGIRNVVAISAYSHCAALQDDGTVVTWGDNGYGQQNLPSNLRDAAAVAVGGFHTVLLRGQLPPRLERAMTRRSSYTGKRVFLNANATGSFPIDYQWFHNNVKLEGATNRILCLSALTSQQAGEYSVLASNWFGAVMGVVAELTLADAPPAIVQQPTPQAAFNGGDAVFTATADGSWPLRYQWRFNGADLLGQTNEILRLQGVTASQYGDYTLTVVNAFGTSSSSTVPLTKSSVYAWGDNAAGQSDVVPGLTNILAVSSGSSHNLALRGDGTVVGWGCNAYYGQARVPPGLNDVIAIACGRDSSLALRRDGTLANWGHESSYQRAFSNVLDTCAGFFHQVALLEDESMAFWGTHFDWNQNRVPSWLFHVTALAAGEFHTLALRQDGRVIAWGWNEYGQCEVPASLTNVVAVSAGWGHSLALRQDGTVVAWGIRDGSPNCDYGQAAVPSGLSNVVAIASGLWHNLALRADGSLVAWGRNDFNQTNVPAICSNLVAIAAGERHSVVVQGDGTPFIVQPPQRRWAFDGETVSFTALAMGEQPLRYQWRFNGTDLPGETNCTLRLPLITSQSAGQYSVNVRNRLGEATSRAAALVISPQPRQCRLVNPSIASGTFSTCFASTNGVRYILEYKNSLADPDWIPLTGVKGDGNLLELQETEQSTGSQRFFRVRMW